jgi:hypothetical protein
MGGAAATITSFCAGFPYNISGMHLKHLDAKFTVLLKV